MKTDIKYDKKIVIKTKHGLIFKKNQKLLVDGFTFKVVNCIFDKKNSYHIFLKYYDNTFAKSLRKNKKV